MSSKAFYGIFKIFSFLLCFGLFLFLMLYVWQKYYDGMTNIGSRFDDQDEGKKSLPCVTFCPYSSFKKKGLFFKHEDFIQQTYEKEELFYNFHKSKLANKNILICTWEIATNNKQTKQKKIPRPKSNMHVTDPILLATAGYKHTFCAHRIRWYV